MKLRSHKMLPYIHVLALSGERGVLEDVQRAYKHFQMFEEALSCDHLSLAKSAASDFIELTHPIDDPNCSEAMRSWLEFRARAVAYMKLVLNQAMRKAKRNRVKECWV